MTSWREQWEAWFAQRRAALQPRMRFAWSRPLLAGLVGVLVLVVWLAGNRFVLVPHTRPWAFALPWAALRAWLFEGASPYAQERAVALARTWLSGPAVGAPLPPFPILLLYLPFALVPSGPWAYALWLMLQQAMLVATVAAWMRGARRAGTLGLALGLWALLWPGLAAAWNRGSPDALAVFGLALAWQAFRAGRDTEAGLWALPALLALDAAMWPLVGWGMWALSRSRRRGPVTWLGSAFGLAVAAQWLRPGWLGEYARAFPAVAPWRMMAVTDALMRVFPGLGPRVAISMAGVLFLWLLLQGARAWVAPFPLAMWTWHWTAATAPGLGLLLIPERSVWLLPAWLLVWSTWIKRWRYGEVAVHLTAPVLLGLAGIAYTRLDPALWAAGAMLLGIPLTWLGLSLVRWWYLRPEPEVATWI